MVGDILSPAWVVFIPARKLGWVIADLMLNFFFFLIGVELFYNVVLVSAVQQSESALCIHVTPPSWPSLQLPHPTHLGHHRAVELSSLLCSGLYGTIPWAIYLHLPIEMVVYICQSHSPNSSPRFPPQHWVHTSVFYICISIPALKIGF